MVEKSVLYLGGGSMAGVFGAGIVTKLQEENAHEKIKTIFGASAGAFNMAYFLSKQTRLGSRIYYEDLTENFIDAKKILSGTAQRFYNRFIFRIPIEKMYNPINIDYLIQIAKTQKVLDIDAIKDSKIQAFVKVFNLDTKKIEYLDLKRNTFQRLHEAVSVIPYYFPNNQNFIDGEVISPIDFDTIRNFYPHEKIVVCLNHSPEEGLSRKTRNTLEGLVATMMYKEIPLVRIFYNKTNKINQEIEKIKQDKNSLLIFPPENNPSGNSTTDKEKLLTTYEMGQIEAEKILDFI